MCIPNYKKIFIFVSLVLVLILLTLFGTEINNTFRYERSLISEGEIWRLISGHFVHMNDVHGAVNILALGLIVAMLGHNIKLTHWVYLSLYLCLFISSGLFIFSPDIAWYVGLSGVLHGMLAFTLLNKGFLEDKLYLLGVLVVVAKIIREQLPEFNVYHLEAYISGAVVVDAHLYGAIGGCVASAFFFIFSRLKKLY